MAVRIVYLTSERGRAYVAEFIDGIRNAKEQAALIADIAMLAEAGPVLPFPLTTAIASFVGLRELRTRFGNAQYRIIYLVQRGDVVLLHAFKKTASSQTRREYATAAERARRIRNG
jgi:phage-related protein